MTFSFWWHKAAVFWDSHQGEGHICVWFAYAPPAWRVANFKVQTWFSNGRMPKTDIFLINVASSAIYWGLNVPGIVLGTSFASPHFILRAVLHWLVLPRFTSEDKEAEKVHIMPQILYWVIMRSRLKARSTWLPRLFCASSITGFYYGAQVK